MLDADAQQTIGTAKAEPRTRTSTSGIPTSRPASSRPGESVQQARASLPAEAPAPRKNAQGPTVGRSPHQTTRGGTARFKKPRPLSKGETWSVGGLTISVRMLVGLAVMGVLLVTLVPLGLQWLRQEQAYAAILAEVSAAELRNEEMRDQLADWENEDFVAGQARERLGYVRPGEIQFVVIDAPPVEISEDEGSLAFPSGPDKPWMWNLAERLRIADASSEVVDHPVGNLPDDTAEENGQ